MTRINNNGKGRMGTVYNQEEKKDTSLDWVSHYGGLSISLRLFFQLFSWCIGSKQMTEE